jgi:hypothetical protein
MAEIHVLTTTGGKVRFALHIPIPSANNSVGVNWRTALVNSGVGGKTELKDGDGTAGTIDNVEKPLIVSGALYETFVEKGLPSNWGAMNGAQRNAWLDALYNANQNNLRLALEGRLGLFGAVKEVT